MTVTTTYPLTIHAPTRTSGLRALTVTETRLYLRTPVALFWTVLFPLAGLVVMGVIPGTRTPVRAFGGATVLETYIPIIIAYTLTMTAVNSMPSILVNYRERGILRRLSTTPVPPRDLLGAQLILNMAVQTAMTLLLLLVAAFAFGTHLPRQAVGFVLAFVLALAALSALGMLIAAVTWTARAATVVGGTVYTVLMYFSGLWWPRAEMPSAMRHLSDAVPSGAIVQSLQDTAAGHWPHPLQLAVMAGYAVICGFLAARLFRWE
jgi:ABC-2 type transport system permease protein